MWFFFTKLHLAEGHSILLAALRYLLGPRMFAETLTLASLLAPASAPATQVWEPQDLSPVLSYPWGCLVWTGSFNASYRRSGKKIKPMCVKRKISQDPSHQDPLGSSGQPQALLTFPSQWVWGWCHQVYAPVQQCWGQPSTPWGE